MDQNQMKKEILDFNPEKEEQMEASNDRFHILSDDEIDSMFEEENPLDSTTTLDEIATMDFNDYEVVKTKQDDYSQIPVEKMENPPKKKKKDCIILDDRVRFIISFSLIVILFFVSVSIFVGSLSNSPKNDITYSETSDIQYKVYLKDNDIYQQEYLDERMTYISSLIQLIKIKMNYQLACSEEANIQYQYHIVANMIIVDKNDPNKIYYNDKSILVNEVTDKIENGNELSIDKEVSIDYAKYNEISNRFRSSYGYDTNNYLVVSLVVHTISDDPFAINQTSTPSIQIPLSQENIQIHADKVKKHRIILADKHYPIRNLFQFFIGFLLGVFSLFIFAKFIIQFLENEKEKKLQTVRRYEKKKNNLED